MSVSVLCMLLLLSNTITLSTCEDITFYIKPVFGDCPTFYQPCLTLDEFARDELSNGNFSNVSLTLILLSGEHILCETVTFRDIDSVAMIGMNSSFDLENPHAAITLSCFTNIEVTDVYGFSLSYLEINGIGENSVVIWDGVGEVSIFQTKVVASAVLISSGDDISVNIQQVLFKASKINVNSTFVTSIMIKDSTFLSGDQLQTLAFCHKGFNHSVNILLKVLIVSIDNVTVSDLSQSDANLEPPKYFSTFCDSYDSQLDTSSDFHLLLQPSNMEFNYLTIVSVSITNSNFIHDQKSSTAIILELVQLSLITISNTIISGYSQGAIVLLNVWAPVVFELTNTTIVGNSLSHPILEDLEMNAGAALTIYNYIHELLIPIPMLYQVSKCLFQSNSDNQENSEIILIYGVHSLYVEDSTFINNHGTPISAHDSKVSLQGFVKFESNSAKCGGALALYTSVLKLSMAVEAYFHNNSASEFGGVVYVENPSFDFITNINRPCFYHLSIWGSDTSDFNLLFTNNTAKKGGDNIYGAQLRGKCKVNAVNYNVNSLTIFTFIPNNTLSPVSSRATRVCLCDSDGYPQCTNASKIFVTDIAVYPGEFFSISVVTVGAEFGTTTGNVYAKLQQPSSGPITGQLGSKNQAYQRVQNKDNCTSLRYSIHSQSKHETMYLASIDTIYRQAYEEYYKSYIETAIHEYVTDDTISAMLLTVPVFVNITLKDCPPGFEMTGHSLYTYCDCYAELHSHNISCVIQDGVGHIIRNGNNWIGVSEEEIIFNDNCLLEYCEQESVTVNIQGMTNESDSQCAFNHAGILCGGCEQGYSLSLGSSHCLYCHESSTYAALIAFLLGGLILVGIVLLLDLTIGNGGMNGLIFYANIIWAYRLLIFPHSDADINSGLLKAIKYFFKIFIATLNLDIGTEICFWNGMDAFWKSIFQFAFPIYIWIITSVAIVVMKYLPCCVRCIQRCAKCKCAQRPVEVLVTLILMSYAKLIRTILGVFTFSILKIYPGGTTKVVWGLDGNVPYLSGKHIALFIIALFALFLALAYTIYISIVGLKHCIFKDDNDSKCVFKMCRKILDMPLPLYDAHFASFKKNHKYWLGLLLFVRAILLLIFSSTLGISPVVNLPILILIITLLLFWMGWKDIYKKKSVWALQGLSLSNLIAISGGVLFAELSDKEMLKSILVCVSVGIAFLQFAGIAVHSIVQYFRKCALPNSSGSTVTETDVQNANDQSDGAVDVGLYGTHEELREPLLDDYSDYDT